MKKILSIFAVVLLLAGFALGYFATPSYPIDPAKKESYGVHYAFLSYKNFYEDAFLRASLSEHFPGKNIPSIIVNHHLLAPQLIAETFLAVSDQKPDVVVLLSPDHFERGRNKVSLSQYDWETPYGRLVAHQKIIEKISRADFVSIEESPFKDEHGISNIVAFLKRTFPHTEFVPLIIKETLTHDEAEELTQLLHSALPEDALLVGSFDFSHYLPERVAEFHDRGNIAVLENLAAENTRNMDIDSQTGLEVLLRYTRLRGGNSFKTIERSSSSLLTGDFETQENTSYVVGYFTRENEMKNDPPVTLFAAGDIFLDRFVRSMMEKKGKEYPFQFIERLFLGSDVSLVNFEGPFTDFSSQAKQPMDLRFTFDPKLLPYLHRIGINMTSLANNHTANFGKEGLRQSKKYLSESGIDFFGDPFNEAGNSLLKEIRGEKIAFIGYHQFINPDIRPFLEEIKKFKEGRAFVVVYPHWGIEYSLKPHESQRKMAHAFIDAGADLVIGSHPHVIEPTEIYRDRLILYSLGNFLFDQTEPETKKGLTLGAVIGSDTVQYYFFPVKNENMGIKLMGKEERDRVFQFIHIPEGEIILPRH